MTLSWSLFTSFIEARSEYRRTPCVYVQASSAGMPLRVGKASVGLDARYRGGTGYALDAAGHESGNLWFVAPVPVDSCDEIERELIWANRGILEYNNLGIRHEPSARVNLRHKGQSPRFVET